MVADGRGHQRDLSRREAPLIEQSEGNQRAALAVVYPVDEVADIVQIPGDLGQLHRALGIAQNLQNMPRLFGYRQHVPEAVVGVADGGQSLVGPRDVGPNHRIPTELLKGHSRTSCGKVTVKTLPTPGVLSTRMPAR